MRIVCKYAVYAGSNQIFEFFMNISTIVEE